MQAHRCERLRSPEIESLVGRLLISLFALLTVLPAIALGSEAVCVEGSPRLLIPALPMSFAPFEQRNAHMGSMNS